jgi:hypothetical protein
MAVYGYVRVSAFARREKPVLRGCQGGAEHAIELQGDHYITWADGRTDDGKMAQRRAARAYPASLKSMNPGRFAHVAHPLGHEGVKNLLTAAGGTEAA